MKAYLDRECLPECFDARVGIPGQHGSGRGHDIDTIGTIAFHEFRLPDKHLWGTHMRHHEEPHRLHSYFPANLEVLLRAIGLGTLRAHPYHFSPALPSLLEV